MNRIKNIGMIVLIFGILLFAGCVEQNKLDKKDNISEVKLTPTVTATVTTVPIKEITPEKTEEKKIEEKPKFACVNTTYIRHDKFNAELKMKVNINTNEIGRLTYIENYYGLNSEGKPVLFSSKRYFDGDINRTDVEFEIGRPLDRRGGAYSQIEIVAILNGNRYTYWYDLHDYWK